MSTLILPGQTGYSLGSWSDTTPNTSMFISRSTCDGTHATITVNMWQGPFPVIGQLLATSSVSNIPTVSNVAISGVNLDANGNGTISYLSAHAPVTDHADVGLAIIPQSEIPVLIPVSLPLVGTVFSLPQGQGANARVLTWQTLFPSAPATVVVQLQAAMPNPFSPTFGVLDQSTNVSGDLRFVTVQDFQLVRVAVTACSGGTLPSIIAKLGV